MAEQAFSDFAPKLSGIEGLTLAANKGLYFAGPETPAVYDLTAGGRALGGVAGTADTFPFFSASNVVSLATVTAAGLALLDDVDAAAQRVTLGLVIGTNVQAYSADLTASLGAWQDWTPTVTATTPAGSGFTYTVASARWRKIGKTVDVEYDVTLTSLGTGPSASGLINTTLPAAPLYGIAGCGVETGVSGKGLSVYASAGAASATLRLADATSSAVLSARHRFSLRYEVA